MAWSRQRGFSLIELMIVVAVVGVLAMVAVPSYSKYQQKSRRADAEQLMLSVDTRQKQILIEQRAYATAIGATNVASTGWTCTSSGTVPGTCTNAWYEMTFSPAVDNTATPPSYTICAKPINAAQTEDGTLTLTSVGAKKRVAGTTCTTSGTDLGW
jgi:type IV pilus assembly protein PilE